MADGQGGAQASGAELTAQEKSFLARLAVACLIVSAAFAGAAVGWGVGFPSTFVAFLCGIALATLSYAFLGGVRNNEISVGGAKLAGTVAVVVAVFVQMPKQLHGEMNDIGRIAAAEKELDALKSEADRIRSTLVIDTGMAPQPIAGGGTVDLVYVRATDGSLARLPSHSRERTLAALLAKAEITGVDAAQLLAMSETQYAGFLAQLEKQSRTTADKLNEIPFAELRITASDGRPSTVVALSGGPPIPVLRDGQPEAYLCIRRVLDVKESGSMEREVVILEHSREQCS
jgi:hypothetical protein